MLRCTEGASLTAIMTPSTPTSKDFMLFPHESSSLSRRLHTPESKERPRSTEHKVFWPPEKKFHYPDSKKVHWSMPMNEEREYSPRQPFTPLCPSRASSKQRSSSGGKRKSRAPPAVPEPPRLQRLSTPELSDVEEDYYFGRTSHQGPASSLEHQSGL